MDGKNKDEDRFHILKKMFTLAGTPVYPDQGSRLYNVYRVIVVVSGYLTLVTIFIEVLANLDDMDYVMETARPGFVMVNLLWIHFFISLKMDGVRNLLDMVKYFTWSELPPRNSETGSLTMAGWIQRIQPLMWRMNFGDWCAHVLYLILRSFTRPNPLFFNAWSPFDINSKPLYILVLIVQGFGSVMQATALFAFMGLYVALVAVGCTQLEKIQSALLDIKQRQEKSHSEMDTHLIQCVQHHQRVLRYMKELENTFSPVLIGPFLSVVAAMCFTAFTAMTISGNFVEIIQICLITFSLMFQIQAVCWFGTELAKQSGRVRDAAWASDWVGASTSFQKSLMFIIAVSKDFTLTAGKIIPVYQSTVMVILNETYTYLMVLMNCVKKSSANNVEK